MPHWSLPSSKFHCKYVDCRGQAAIKATLCTSSYLGEGPGQASEAQRTVRSKHTPAPCGVQMPQGPVLSTLKCGEEAQGSGNHWLRGGPTGAAQICHSLCPTATSPGDSTGTGTGSPAAKQVESKSCVPCIPTWDPKPAPNGDLPACPPSETLPCVGFQVGARPVRVSLCTLYPLQLVVGGGAGRQGTLPLILVEVAQGHAPSLTQEGLAILGVVRDPGSQ